MRYSFPPDYGTKGCALIFVDVSLMPIIAGMLAPLEEPRLWVEGDYPAAYRAIADLEAAMTLTCVQDLVESNNRLYRLIDWSLNGRVYDAGDSPPDSITPAIPDVPNTDISSPGMVRTQVVIRNMLSNALNGDVNDDFSILPSIRDQLQSIIDGLAADDTSLEDVLSELEIIASLLA
jgi:hypothetical protein